jgi:hypothetical protein
MEAGKCPSMPVRLVKVREGRKREDRIYVGEKDRHHRTIRDDHHIISSSIWWFFSPGSDGVLELVVWDSRADLPDLQDKEIL